MKKIKMLTVMAFGALLLSSCTAPVAGMLFTGVTSPMAVTSNANSTKVGTASAIGVLGLVAVGDASIDKAAKSAGITKIHHVDQKNMSILGLFFTSYKIYVYGE